MTNKKSKKFAAVYESQFFWIKILINATDSGQAWDKANGLDDELEIGAELLDIAEQDFDQLSEEARIETGSEEWVYHFKYLQELDGELEFYTDLTVLDCGQMG